MRAKYWIVRPDGSETERYDSLEELHRSVLQGSLVIEVTGYTSDDETILLENGKVACDARFLRTIPDHVDCICCCGSDECIDNYISEVFCEIYNCGGSYAEFVGEE